VKGQLKKKLLLLSGYDAASHRYWRNLLEEKLPQFSWTQVALPDRHFSWRVRGNSLNFAFQHKEAISKRYDLIIATSMVDLASLKGFIPQLGQTPSLVYFHENQFEYPLSDGSSHSNSKANAVNAQLTSIYSALAADKVVFNTHYNRNSFFSGAKRFLKRLPDKLPEELLTFTEKNSKVLAVPINDVQKTEKPKHRVFNEVPHIVWNHRWEYDKQPDVFFSALKLLKQSGQKFKLHIMGQSFRQVPECFHAAKLDFAEEILTFGFQSKPQYEAVLNTCDIVVSSALHDFQGLSLMEAISSGCTPIAPNRVAYPEYVSPFNLYCVSQDKNEVESLFKKLKEVIAVNEPNNPNLSAFQCDTLIPQYLELIESLINI
jgi:glycosyltransferase involved in cell wall biosynthesis